MIYRTLGKTGLKVSQLGFGAMRLPMKGEGSKSKVNRDLAIPMIHRAFDLGVNYIDTAVFYCEEDSQNAVGEALKGRRHKIILSTKNHYYGDNEKEWWTNFENSLEQLDVRFIDIYNHHGINWQAWKKYVEPHISKWMNKAKDQGLIKHICFSFHLNQNEMILIDKHLKQLKKLADLYCTSCNYCMPCPNEVNIPKIFEYYNRGRVYDLWENARKVYRQLGKPSSWDDKGNKANACSDCGACEKKCPQKIPIRKQLKEAHKALT